MSQYESHALFGRTDLRSELYARQYSIKREIEALEERRFLATDPDALIRYFMEKDTRHVPTLDRDESNWEAEHVEFKLSHSERGMTTVRAADRIDVFIPFNGEAALFDAYGAKSSSASPHGRVQGHHLVLSVTPAPGATPAATMAGINAQADQVESHLAWLRELVDDHNKAIPELARIAIGARRKRLHEKQGFLDGLGVRIRERPDAARASAMPAIRRKVTPVLPSPSGSKHPPEPFLEAELYDHILKVMANMAHVMERSPRAFLHTREETLRDHFLFQLNGQFEGMATGETFNGDGKTDILIRANDRNVFIAECKFWKGARGYLETIDQLLGYSTWRDSKTAILIFNRNRDTSRVLREVEQTTAAHPCFKRPLPWPSDTGSRCVLKHPSDDARELTLTTLVFDVPASAPSPTE